MITIPDLPAIRPRGLQFRTRRASCLSCHYSVRVRSNGDLSWHRLWFGHSHWNYCPGARREKVS